MACKRSAVRSRVAPPNSCYKKPKGHRYRGGLFVLAHFSFSPSLARKKARIAAGFWRYGKAASAAATTPGQRQQGQQQGAHGTTTAVALFLQLEVDDDGVVVGGAERVAGLDHVAAEVTAVLE